MPHPQDQSPPRYPGHGRVLRVKEGYNPNSSSLGSVVFALPAALLAAPALLAGTAAFLALARRSTTVPEPADEETEAET